MGTVLDHTFSRRRSWKDFCFRIFAIIGIILIFERTSTWFLWRVYPEDEQSFSSISRLGDHLGLDLSFGNSKHTTPGESLVRKAIVVASIKREHTEWIAEQLPDWDVINYVTDDPNANLTTLMNRGREANVYLTYLINNYADLPDYIVFLHARRYQWHNDDPMYDGAVPVRNLRLGHLDSEGYVSLRCAQDPGCPIGVKPDPKGQDGMFSIDRAYADTFKEFFPGEWVPRMVSAPCCAQFAVTKAQVLKRPVREYERYRQWLWETNLDGGRTGRILEYMWHIIFGKNAVYCPPADTCYCSKFGLCDLKCPDKPKSCLGRFTYYAMNTDGLPGRWPNKGQGENGWPVDKWWEEFYPPDKYDGFNLREKDSAPSTSRTA